MGKKGRQSAGFGSKAKRAAFAMEWQSLASEVTLSRGANRQKQSQKTATAKERPKLRLNHLQNMLQERLHHDRLEDAAQRHHKRNPPPKSSTPLLSHDDAYRETGLVLLCVKALAPVLQDYIAAMGKDSTHYYLSLLPGKTLTALSVELSTRGLWKTDDMVYVVSHHAHLSRLVICGNNPANSTITSTGVSNVLLLQPTRKHVPESWEDDNDECIEEEVLMRRLQRLDLRNMPSLPSETVLAALLQSSVTHLSLCGSLDYQSGLDFLEIFKSHHLKVLDVTNCVWMTPGLVLRVRQNHPLLLLLHGCELLEEKQKT
jgi:hypothetical protein